MRLFTPLLLILVASSAYANDASFGGEASALIPLQETKIQMISEEVGMEQKKSSYLWHVKAHYSFHNPTDEAVVLQMGFPERRCDVDDPYLLCNGDGRFQNLKTWVRGQRIQEKKGRVAAKNRWAPKLADVYLYEVTFAPKETLEIKHEYSYDGSVYVAGDFAEYVTETGGLWNGPIQNAKFVIRTWKRPLQIIFPSTFKLQSYLEHPQQGGGGITEVVFAMQNWRPKEDLTLFLERALDFDENSSWFEPEELKKMSLEELKTGRNKIFAHHGFPFKDPQWRKLFYQPPQIEEDFLYEADWQKKTNWVHIGFTENPHYQESLLTPAEKKLVNLLSAEEKNR